MFGQNVSIECLLLFRATRLWTRFFKHLNITIYLHSYILTYCIGTATVSLSACYAVISYRLYTHTFRCSLVSAHTHTCSSTCAHMSLTLMWSDQTELPANRPSDWTVNVGPHYQTWQHWFHTHTESTVGAQWELGLRFNMTAEIAAFINVWPFPPRCPFLLCPSLPFTVRSN